MPAKKTTKPAVSIEAAKPAKLAKLAKTAVAKLAPKKKEPAAPKAAKSAGMAKSSKPVTVIVRHDAGWGNHLHLRGEGPGLCWESGSPLCCVQGDEWVWVAPASGAVTFKVLHNDTHWSAGDNIIVAAGETLTLRPVF